MKAEMVMKKENNKWYIGWIIFPAWYLIGKKYIILPVIQSVFEAMSYSDVQILLERYAHSEIGGTSILI